MEKVRYCAFLKVLLNIVTNKTNTVEPLCNEVQGPSKKFIK